MAKRSNLLAPMARSVAMLVSSPYRIPSIPLILLIGIAPSQQRASHAAVSRQGILEVSITSFALFVHT